MVGGPQSPDPDRLRASRSPSNRGRQKIDGESTRSHPGAFRPSGRCFVSANSRTIPVVFVNVSDPIGAGFIVSLAQPGGNFTGVLHYEVGILGKWLAMLKEIAPNITRAALVGDPKSPVYGYFISASQAPGRSLAIELVPLPVENAADIERSIDSFASGLNGGFIFPPDITTITTAILFSRLRRNTSSLRSIHFVCL